MSFRPHSCRAVPSHVIPNECELNDPSFEEIQDGFRVTFFKTTQKTTQKKSTRERVFEELKLNPKITREELATLLGESQSTIKEHLSRLKAAGRMARVGSDRDGYWKVL